MERSYEVFGSDGEVIEQGMKDVDWIQVRAARDAALEDSDWRAGKDVVLSTAWREFRQELRDLPQNSDSANDAADAWPVMPDA